jgi:hypothetical protein
MTIDDPIQDVRDTILGIVRGGIEQRPDGVHLTFVGAQFARIKGLSFEQYMGFLDYSKRAIIPIEQRKLLPFISSNLGDFLSIVRDSETGSEKVVMLHQPDPKSAGLSSFAISSTTRFKRPVWAAFVRPLPEGYRRFVNLGDVTFKDASRKPNGTDWIEVEAQYIVQTPVGEAINGPLVQANIGEWAREKSIDIENFVSDESSDLLSGASLSDLVKIIRALPIDVTQRWSIPADVFRHLKTR